MADVSPDVLRGVTQRVVDLYTREGFLFTALDVSNSVKQTLPSVRHREVSPVVRDLFAVGAMGDGYTQTLIDVVADRKTVQAFLYHLKGADLEEDYAEDKRHQLAIPPVSVDDEDDGEDAEEDDEVVLAVGVDGRLRVPKKLVNAAGITTLRVSAERVGDEIILGMLISGMDPPARAVVLEETHPSLIHVPPSLSAIFDPSEPILARAGRFQVIVSGTIK